MKNFFFKTNDILLAILIIALACGVIAWRMNVIMDYPNTLSEQANSTQTEEQANQDADAAANESDAGADADADKNTADAEADKETAANTDSDNDSASSDTFVDGKLTKTVKVTVQGGSATAAAGCLVDAGLFKSYDDYAKYCKKAGTNPEAIKAGTFSFSSGMSKTAIAKKVSQ